MVHTAGMARAVVCPDKFRSTLSAPEAAAAMVRGLERAGVDDIVACPMADGGEGTLELLAEAVGGSRRTTTVTGPLGDPVAADWLLLPDSTAIVEAAQACGIALVAGQNDPLRASTRGVGELINAVFAAGARRCVVGVGGTATTDGGLPAVEALGWSLAGREVVVACDVTNPFLDAARVFAKQKGATTAQVQLLERRLVQIAEQYLTRTGVAVADLEHAGAAGGLAGGLAAIGARLEPGFDVVGRLVGLERAIEDAEIVVTGEGKCDATSFRGKVVGSACELAAEFEVPHVAVIAGQVTEGARRAAAEYDGVALYALVERVWQEGEAFTQAATLVEEAAVEAARVFLRG